MAGALVGVCLGRFGGASSSGWDPLRRARINPVYEDMEALSGREEYA